MDNTYTDLLQWLKDTHKDVNAVLSNKYIELTYKNTKFDILFPTKTANFHVVEYKDDKYNQEIETMVDKVNAYCINKKPTIKDATNKLLSKLKTMNLGQTSETATKEAEVDSTIDEFDLNVYRLKMEYKKLIPTSKSVFNVEGNVKKIFDESVVADILIDELIELKKWGQDNNINIELNNNNIYSWNIHYSNIKNTKCSDALKEINKKYGYENIQVELNFHDVYYPNYPPQIKILRPRLCKSLTHRIANSKMVQLEYWSTTRNAKYIVQRIKTIIEKWGEIDVESEFNDKSVYTNGAFIGLEGELLKLASLADIDKDDEIDKDEVFIKYITKQTTTKSTAEQKQKTPKPTNSDKGGWKPGTGYGTSGSKDWNPLELLKIQEERDMTLSQIIGNICTELQGLGKITEQYLKPIENSLLIPYLKQQFKSVSLIDMDKSVQLYKLCFNLLQILATEESIYLYDITQGENDEPLYDVLKTLYGSSQIAIKLNSECEFANIIINLQDALIDPLINEYRAKRKNTAIVIVPKKTETNDDFTCLYKKTMSGLIFDTTNIYDTNYKADYKKLYISELSSSWLDCTKRLSTELSSLAKNLPVHPESSIFVRADENKMMIIRALITGPKDTPYDSGCYIFDIYAGSTYPKKNPLVTFMNHGGKRFNPNLYNCGKVCLSILGTWRGLQSESWNEKTSTLLQILVSIQAQILIETPYFNEPTYESQYGTPAGNKHNAEYNDDIRSFVMRHAMLDLLEKPELYPQFTDVIKNHFKLKKEYVLKTCEKWMNESVKHKASMASMYDSIKSKLNSL